MTTFLALYRGRTVADAKLIAVSADPAVVAQVVRRLLASRSVPTDDTAVALVERGRRAALQVIAEEVGEGG